MVFAHPSGLMEAGAMNFTIFTPYHTQTLYTIYILAEIGFREEAEEGQKFTTDGRRRTKTDSNRSPARLR